MNKISHNPDVLSCLANLSNDEVFTPPKLANEILDLLPKTLWQDPQARFLDPFCKTGVFLREISARLMAGLANVIPDVQQRANHILKNQVFGIAVTELTALLSRRSLYGSKSANGKYSMCEDFRNEDGNILYERQDHTWDASGKRCLICGATRGVYDRGDSSETYAYQFIHDDTFVEKNKMKFDVIVGNPPYQLSDGGNAASAVPIYHKFVEQAKKLDPRFLSMILPSRWFTGGRGLDSFRDEMLNDNRIRVIHDYPNTSDCFEGVEIKGGVCYFLWDRDNRGLCRVFSHNGNKVEESERPLLERGMETFIRNATSVRILHKVISKNETSFSSMLFGGRFFGFHTKLVWNDENNGKIQTADGKDFINITKFPKHNNDVKVYVHGGECYIDRNKIPKNETFVNKYKVIIPRSGNPGSTILARPKISEPGSCSSNSFVVVISTEDKSDRDYNENILAYLKSQFVRFLVSIRTPTQDIPPKAYQFVPMQDFSQPWTDEMLYKKYNISEEEIAFIDSMIRPMD